MRRVRLQPGTTQPRGLNMSITMPAAVVPTAAAPSEDCPCGEVFSDWVNFGTEPSAGQIDVYADVVQRGFDTVIVSGFVGGSFPPGTVFDVVDAVWSEGDDWPFYFPEGEGLISVNMDRPLYGVNVFDETTPGVLTFRVRATCPNGVMYSTPLTLTIIDTTP